MDYRGHFLPFSSSVNQDGPKSLGSEHLPAMKQSHDIYSRQREKVSKDGKIPLYGIIFLVGLVCVKFTLSSSDFFLSYIH